MSSIIYKYLETEEEVQGTYKVSAAKENRDWLGGGVVPPILRESLLKKEVIIAKDGDKVVGFIHFHRRKDGYNVIYHRAVLPDYCKKGIAYNLSLKVPFPHEAKCKPSNIPIQNVYKKLGMYLAGKKEYTNKKNTKIEVLIYRHKNEGLFDNC